MIINKIIEQFINNNYIQTLVTENVEIITELN